MSEELLSVKSAQQQLMKKFSPLGGENVPLAQAAGRVLAEKIVSDLDLPPFPNSSMDGFAVRSEDVQGASRQRPVKLKVIADIPAGKVVDVSLQPGQAARIMTGAPLPDGSDAVVPVEDTDFNLREPGVEAPEQVQIFQMVTPGDSVRPRGQDVSYGEIVMQDGMRLWPADIGFLAMLGMPEVPVYRLPKIALFSSGDELVPVGQPLNPGQIHDSNSYTLSSLVDQFGGQAIHLGIVPDQADAVREVLERSVAEQVDLIISSAGVSVGAFDFVRSVVEENGELDFWRVNMRPGKPLTVGNYKKIPFIGLPGNPVSAFVGFMVFVRPVIMKMLGLHDWEPQTRTVRLSESIISDGRESYLRAIVSRSEGGLVARLTGHQGSGNLRSLVQANALLLVPSGVKSLPIGEDAEAWMFGDLRQV